MKEILKGAVVGAGAWSRAQLDAWEKVTGARIVALCDRHPERSAPLLAEYGIDHVHTSCVEMLKAGGIDFLDICTRPYSHEELVSLAIDERVPVLCQKPFCESLEEAERLTRRGEEAGVAIVVNENFRWQSWYRKIEEILKSGRLGRPFLARFLERDTVTMPRFDHPQEYFKEMPRLLMYEMGVHYMDTVRFLFGNPKSVYAKTLSVSDEIAGEDAYVAVLDYGDLSVTIQNSWASAQVAVFDLPARRGAFRPPPVFEIEGTLGTLLLRADRTLVLQSHGGGEEVWRFVEETRPLSRIAAQQHFVDSVRSGSEAETNARDYSRTMALVYSAYESAATGQVVRL